MYVYPYMYYLCMHMNVHVFACTSCHAFMPKQISFPISLFSNSFSDSENLALILHNIYTHFFSIRTLLNVLSFFSLLSSSLFPQTQHTPLPPLCDIPSLHCHFSYLSPLTFLYSLSITYFSPRLYLSAVENRAHLRIFTEPTRHKALTLEKMKRAGWFGWWCQRTSSGDPEV